MFQVKGNLWTLPADVICITTNGFVKNDGRAVMGAGCAKEAKNKYPGIDLELAKWINTVGNHVGTIWTDHKRSIDIMAFPVKHNWWEDADLELIERSCIEIADYANHLLDNGKTFFALPRPGCGNGNLEWKDVKPICEKYLDDRFGIVTF